MRHGKPRVTREARLNGVAFGEWIARYNAAGIADGTSAPQEAITQTNQNALTVCSDLPRSLDSAKALRISNVDV